MENVKRVWINIARIILGLCFIFSGFVKAIDPNGSMYKISDYLEAFDWKLLSDLSWLMAILLAAVEFFIGTALVLGLWKKSISLISLIFMLFMTPFTLYLAIYNPVSDCGCFGDALILTNWQTFFKNIFLLLLAFPVFYWHDLLFEYYGRQTTKLSAYWCFIFPLLLSYYGSQHLPILDFRPYKIGNHLPDMMTIPKGAVVDSFETRFIYQKNGVKKEFSVNNAPLSDTTWSYVDRIEKQIRKGYSPPITDFVINHPVQGDITRKVLNDTSYTFLLVSPKLEAANRSSISNLLSVVDYAKKHHFAFYGLTNSDPKAIEEWNYEYDSEIVFCTVDDRTLKTMIRSNPGIILLKNGEVIQKWAYLDVPDFTEVTKPLDQLKWGRVKTVSTLSVLGRVFLLFILPLLFFYLLHKGYRFHFHLQKNKKNSSNK